MSDSLLNGHGLRSLALAIAHHANHVALRAQHLSSGEEATRSVLRPCNLLKLSSVAAGFKVGANLRIAKFSHAAPQGVAKDAAFVAHGFALEYFVACPSDGFLHPRLYLLRARRFRYLKRTGACGGHDLIGLVTEIGCELTVCGIHLCGRQDLLRIAR